MNSNQASPGKVGPEGQAILRFVRARLDERFAALEAEKTPPVVVNIDAAELAEVLAVAIEGVGKVIAAALIQRQKRSVHIEHSDGSRSTVREA